jgi:hypothetical protein
MRVKPLSRMMSTAALACALTGGSAMGQTQPLEVSLHCTSLKLRPATGMNQVLNGATLGGRYALGSAWSLEAAMGTETGTEAGSVSLRQMDFSFGPRFSLPLTGRWQAFAHVLVGIAHLKATEAYASAQDNSFRYAPGVGVDFAMGRRWSLRGQVDYVGTRYAALTQRSPSFSLGLAFR